MKPRHLITSATIALLAGTIVVQWYTGEQLRAQIASLQQQQPAPPSPTADTNLLAKIEARDAEIARLRNEARDVYRLRGEVAPLRKSATDAERLKRENERLQAT